MMAPGARTPVPEAELRPVKLTSYLPRVHPNWGEPDLPAFNLSRDVSAVDRGLQGDRPKLMSLLPANATARRREEELRERARTETLDRLASMERKLDSAIMGQGAAERPSSPDPAVRKLALDIGQDRVLLPLSVTVSRTLVDEGEMATAIQVGHLTFSIEEAACLGVLLPDGRLDHYRVTALLHAVPQSGWMRPNWEAERPAVRPRP